MSLTIASTRRAPPSRKARCASWCLAVFTVIAAGCGDRDRRNAGATTDATPPPAASAPSPWTMGPGSADRYVLPAGCTSRDPPLVAVVDGSLRLSALAGRTDAAIVQAASATPGDSASATGIMLMRHGTTAIARTLRTHARATPRVSAFGPTSWWVASANAHGASTVWGPHNEAAPAGRVVDGKRAPVDLRCGPERRCALLTSDDDEDNAALWLRLAPTRPDDVSSPWISHPLPRGRGLRILSMSPLAVATADDLRVYVTQVPEPGGTGYVAATLATPDRVLDVATGPAAVTAITDLDPRGCSPEAGGVRLVTPEATRRLRSPTGARRARLVALSSDAWLAVWLAPRRCGSRLTHEVHAAVVHRHRGLAAPPSVVGRADDFALAAEGDDDLGLWMWTADRNERTTVAYLRVQCAVGP
ncbi:MAG: hypothetical protein AAF928_12735 [Myxococcota bacterium]